MMGDEERKVTDLVCLYTKMQRTSYENTGSLDAFHDNQVLFAPRTDRLEHTS